MDPHKIMVERLVRMGIIKSEAVRRAAERVPREEFVLPEYRDQAYDDKPLPIGEGQTISAPHMVFYMNELLDLKPGQLVLEVGTGSGYHAATLAEIVAPSDDPSNWGHVITAEINPTLASFAFENLRATGYANRVHVLNLDGSQGFPIRKKADRILVTAAAPSVPPPLVEQLADGGRMVIPVGPVRGFFFGQDLLLVVKRGGKVSVEKVIDVAFVPLRGKYGWS